MSSIEIEIKKSSIGQIFHILQSMMINKNLLDHQGNLFLQVDTVICQTKDLIHAVTRLCTTVFICQSQVSDARIFSNGKMIIFDLV